jgi:hypothetical protein
MRHLYFEKNICKNSQVQLSSMGKRCKNNNILANVWHLLVEVIDILDVVVEVVVVVIKVTKVILNDDGQSHRCQGRRGPGGDI